MTLRRPGRIEGLAGVAVLASHGSTEPLPVAGDDALLQPAGFDQRLQKRGVRSLLSGDDLSGCISAAAHHRSVRQQHGSLAQQPIAGRFVGLAE